MIVCRARVRNENTFIMEAQTAATTTTTSTHSNLLTHTNTRTHEHTNTRIHTKTQTQVDWNAHRESFPLVTAHCLRDILFLCLDKNSCTKLRVRLQSAMV